MIYVSTSCVKNQKIGESVKQLADAGYRNIELSGGTSLYDGFEHDLLELKAQYNLHYLCHNYFPPPEKDFVLNLASLDTETFQASKNQVKKALDLSKKLGAKKFGFHAGFLLHIPTSEIGKKIKKRSFYDEDIALKQFVSAYKSLKSYSPEVELYVENNVLSKENYESFDHHNPFFLTRWDGYIAMRRHMPFKPLLDVAHLKVTSHTLGLNFEEELKNFIAETDYVHISDNSGLVDSNKSLEKNSQIFKLLSQYNLKNKIFTLEVYTGLNDIQTSFENLNTLLDGK